MHKEKERKVGKLSKLMPNGLICEIAPRAEATSWMMDAMMRLANLIYLQSC